MKHKIIVALCVLVLTITNTVVTVHAIEIETGNDEVYVTPTINPDSIIEKVALGTLADLITTHGVNFNFEEFLGDYNDFINYIIDTIGNAGSSAFNYVAENITNNDLLEWVRNTVSNTNKFSASSSYLFAQLGLQALNYPQQDESQVPSEYASYIQLMNGTSGTGLDFFWRDYQYIPNSAVKTLPTSQTDYSFVLSTLSYKGRNYTNPSYNIVQSQFDSGYYILYSDIITIYINEEQNTKWLVSAQINTDIPQNFTPNNLYFYQARAYNGNVSNSQAYMTSRATYQNSYKVTSIAYEFDSLDIALLYCSQAFRNVNIVVNGQTWANVGGIAQNKLIYTPDKLKYDDTEYNIHVTYAPQGVYLDLDALKQIIQDIIDNKDVLTYNDISDVFVDYDGQKAIATYQVNYMPDDDTINIMYPTQPNFEQFNNDMSELTGNTSGIFLFTLLFNTVPPEVWGALCAGALIVLFACLIKRMLE